MDRNSHKQIASFISLLILICFFTEIPAEQEYDYNHRRRDCEITLLSAGGEPLAGTLVGIGLIRNDFAFGGTIRSEGFDSLGDDYGEWFLSYFDVATPENEMKWENAMKCAQKCNPEFSKADSLLAWLEGKKIAARGHALFSNEKENRIPEWTRNLSTSEFKKALQERINTAMDHFKGKVDLWDIINEICHGEDGSFIASSLLETKSGDPDILHWILDEARKKDSSANFIINDYSLITSGDQTAADNFITKVKPLVSKFEIVGAKGHFGANINKASWEPKINYIAQQLGKPVWLTDVDFSIDVNQAPDKIEELMRTCFANPKVSGLTIGSWCGAFEPHSDLSSFFIDSLNYETPVGERWREVRDEWKTETIGSTDESGKFTFNGFHGKYQILISCYLDTFYLEPGEGTKTVNITHLGGAAAHHAPATQKTTELRINGIAIPIKLPSLYNKPLFLTTWSLSGQQLSRSPVELAGGKYQIPTVSSSCRVFRIETADRQTFYSGKFSPVR